MPMHISISNAIGGGGGNLGSGGGGAPFESSKSFTFDGNTVQHTVVFSFGD